MRLLKRWYGGEDLPSRPPSPQALDLQPGLQLCPYNSRVHPHPSEPQIHLGRALRARLFLLLFWLRKLPHGDALA